MNSYSDVKKLASVFDMYEFTRHIYYDRKKKDETVQGSDNDPELLNVRLTCSKKKKKSQCIVSFLIFFLDLFVQTLLFTVSCTLSYDITYFY